MKNDHNLVPQHKTYEKRKTISHVPREGFQKFQFAVLFLFNESIGHHNSIHLKNGHWREGLKLLTVVLAKGSV